MNVIQTKNLTKKFGEFTAVNKINLDIPRGQICGFLGPNGSGKTTTIRMLLGLSQPSSGEVILFDMDFKENKSKILSKIGALVDSPSFYDHLTGYENLKIMKLIHNNTEEKIKEVLNIVELTHASNKKVREYSLGMKQRLGIAIALMNDPQLIILDEPTNGLDPSGIKKIRELLINLSIDKGISIVVSSHNLFEIEQMCNYVCLINNGELLYQGDIKKLLANFKEDKIYFATNNNIDSITYINKYDKKYKTLIEGNYLQVTTEKKDIPKLNKLLMEKGMDVYEIIHKRASLEDIFLELTKERD